MGSLSTGGRRPGCPSLEDGFQTLRLSVHVVVFVCSAYSRRPGPSRVPTKAMNENYAIGREFKVCCGREPDLLHANRVVASFYAREPSQPVPTHGGHVRCKRI